MRLGPNQSLFNSFFNTILQELQVTRIIFIDLKKYIRYMLYHRSPANKYLVVLKCFCIHMAIFI